MSVNVISHLPLHLFGSSHGEMDFYRLMAVDFLHESQMNWTLEKINERW